MFVSGSYLFSYTVINMFSDTKLVKNHCEDKTKKTKKNIFIYLLRDTDYYGKCY